MRAPQYVFLHNNNPNLLIEIENEIWNILNINENTEMCSSDIFSKMNYNIQSKLKSII